MLRGVAEGCNPNRLFDTCWYLSAYPEASCAKINPLVHYILKGARLGYEPHPFFSTKKFLQANPAVAESDLTPLANLLHYRGTLKDDAFPKFGPYDVFKATQENERQRERPQFMRHIEIMTFVPNFVILIDGGERKAVEATRKSLSQQIYSNFQVVNTIEDVARIDKIAPGSTYFLWLDAGDQLDQDALYELASTLNADPGLEMIYFDHEIAGEDGPIAPMHKPMWSPDYLESCDYIGSAACFEWSRAIKFLLPTGAKTRYDFILRFSELHAAITNLDRVLLRRPPTRSSPETETSDIHAIECRLARTNRSGTARVNIPGGNSYNVDICLPSSPLVSIVMPTAARVIDYEGRRVDLIVSCLESIIAKSSYKNIEFVIVDNGDFDRGRLKHIGIERIRFVTYSLPDVNIAKKINLGASYANGDIFLLMNDDIEVLASDWIEHMLAHLKKPHVGIVGAKLMYPNMTIQHAGVVMCDGDPDHVRRGWPRGDVGYAFSTCGVRNYLAVTGAVSMVRARNFWQVGGYSEELPIDFNDIDFCFKLREAGYFVVYEPRAELIHYESVSAVKPPRPQDARLFRRKWASIPNDPFYNEYCFSKHPATYGLAYGERRS